MDYDFSEFPRPLSNMVWRLGGNIGIFDEKGYRAVVVETKRDNSTARA